GNFPSIDNQLSIDQYKWNPFCILVRIDIGGAVTNLFGIKDGHIGPIALFEHSAILQPEDLCRQGSHRSNCKWERNYSAVQGVMTNLAWKCSVKARVRDAISHRHSAAITAGRGKLLLHDVFDIVFAERKSAHPRAARTIEPICLKPDYGLDRVFFAHSRDFTQGLFVVGGI